MVTATDQALALIARLVGMHGPLMFHQSGGCCNGSAPMCFTAGEFKLGARDVLLGEVGGQPFYIGGDQRAGSAGDDEFLLETFTLKV